MGILYIDEAGNSGIKDLSQPNLMYGGPYIKPGHWKIVVDEFNKIEQKYKNLIYQKFNKPTSMPSSFDYLATQISFFKDFYFHSAEMINGKKLWGKLNLEEKFQVLDDLITIMINNDINFYAGILQKQNLLKSIGNPSSMDAMIDYKTLLPKYFQYVEQNIGEENYVVIIDDGDPAEKQVLHETLQDGTIQKCIPELIIQKSKSTPILQLADAGLWVIQSYHRLESTDQKPKARKIRDLYVKLQPILKIHSI